MREFISRLCDQCFGLIAIMLGDGYAAHLCLDPEASYRANSHDIAIVIKNLPWKEIGN